jgi:hypothetical protein
MNLPNYFIADLPPEHVFTPTLVTEACQTLKRNREQYLLGRSTSSIVGVLAATARSWLEPDNPFRNLALQRGVAETGFSEMTLARGLETFFQQFTAENLNALYDRSHEQYGGFGARPGIAGPYRGGKYSEPNYFQHYSRLSGALCAVREMRSGHVLVAAFICAFDLRSRAQARVLPGNRGVEGRNGDAGIAALRGS